jgi:hypothetical protein
LKFSVFFLIASAAGKQIESETVDYFFHNLGYVLLAFVSFLVLASYYHNKTEGKISRCLKKRS